MTASARGCAGIALTGDLAHLFAPLGGTPLAAAAITEVDGLADALEGARLEPLWSLDAGGGVRWSLHTRAADDALVFSIADAPALVADPGSGSIHLGRHPATAGAQLVAAVGAPALAAAHGAVPIHAASAARPGDGATLIVGPSGAGKSSLLCALTDAGWHPISEDVTVVATAADGSAEAWPGPPWVRLAPGQAGPAGSEQRPDPTDKISWDLAGRLAPGPTPLRRVVVLAPPGADAPSLEPLTPAEAIAVLPPHITWVSTRPRAEAAFAAAVTLSRRCPVARLRLPRHPDWARLASDLLRDP